MTPATPTRLAPAPSAVREVAPSTLRLIAEALIPWGLLAAIALVLFLGVWLRLGSGPLVWGRSYVLPFLALVPLLAAFHFHLGRRRVATLTFSRTADLRAASRTLMRRLVHLPRALRLAAIGLALLALARPQRTSADIAEVEGIDIVIALDVSNSMSEPDMRPNRLEAAKRVLLKFIAPRESDRIGLVIFGREAFTQCPLTLDHHALAGLLGDVRLDLIDGRGTAIGNALGTALNRLRKSDAKSKVIILLTDGDSNAGNLAPQQAARYAQSLGVKIFTVLMGRDADINVNQDPFGGAVRAVRYPVNPKLLEEIAGLTGGTPYLATDASALEKRLQAILDELDRSRLKDQKGRPQELFQLFAALALLLLLLEFVLALTRFRRFP
ncbi:MAG: VWA domain-containing protein [Myxococcales bacterium]|nr:VWA domain-containing protein [Myxococcales bacterium]